MYIRSKNNPSGYDMDKHVSFYTEKTLDTFNTLTATRVSDEILFQATWCATVAKHILYSHRYFINASRYYSQE